VTYLLATVNDYRMFASSHCIYEVRLSNASWHDAKDFYLDDCIVGGAFDYPQGITPVTLMSNIELQVVWLLSETALTDEQRLTPLPESYWLALKQRYPMISRPLGG